jgi:N-acetylglucosamine kinase-like BadF-type ATPase
MKYVIGIDGGGKKSIVRAVSLQEKLLGEARGGPRQVPLLVLIVLH